MSILIHDGRRQGHTRWVLDALGAGSGDGCFISPFCTPRVSTPRYDTGGLVAAQVHAVNGEVIFDPMTHAHQLPGSDRLDLYDTWGLWGPNPTLATVAGRLDHVERVLARQHDLQVPKLAPTVALEAATGPHTRVAFGLAEAARAVDAGTWQALAGKRSFWRSGPALDAYVGRLATLRASTWVVTVVNEVVADFSPEMSDVDAFEGLLRTIHSLSLRSRVIVAYADFSGLPATAAGADTLGSGWDRGMKVFDPLSFRNSTPGIRIPASYVTQGQLGAVLRRDAAEVVVTLNPVAAEAIRGGAMPAGDAGQRVHHLGRLREVVQEVDSAPTRSERVDRLRRHYRGANAGFDFLVGQLPGVFTNAQRTVWVTRPEAALAQYAAAEGL